MRRESHDDLPAARHLQAIEVHTDDRQPAPSPWSKTRRITVTTASALAALLTLVAWSMASPPGSSPDDDYHLASIWCAQGFDDERCARDPGDTAKRVLPPLASGAGTCFATDFAASGKCQEALRSTTPSVSTDHGNWEGAYPPVFYAFMSLFVGDDVASAVLLMRLATSVLTVVMVGTLVWLLPNRRKSFAGIPLLLTSLPLGVSLFASTNPSSWTILGIAMLWPALYFAFETTGRRQWLLSGYAFIAALIAAGSRADACLFVATVVALVAMMRVQRLRSQPIVTGALALTLTLAGYLFLNAGHSAELTQPAGPGLDHGLDKFHQLLINLSALPTIWLGGFGSGPMGRIGWLDTPFPPLVGVLLVSVWFLALVQGFRRLFPAKALGLALIGAALVAYPIVLLAQSGNLVGELVQPRYVLPILVLFTAVSLLSPDGITLTLSPRAFIGCVVALGFAQMIALHLQMRRYITGMDISLINLDQGREWWWGVPLPATLVWLVGSVAFAALCALLLRPHVVGPEQGGLAPLVRRSTRSTVSRASDRVRHRAS